MGRWSRSNNTANDGHLILVVVKVSAFVSLIVLLVVVAVVAGSGRHRIVVVIGIVMGLVADIFQGQAPKSNCDVGLLSWLELPAALASALTLTAVGL